MSEEIIKLIDELGKRFGIIIDWSDQNIIPYLQELIKRFICYQNIKACILIIISIVIVIVAVIIINFINKWRKSESYNSDYYDDDEFLALLGYICSICIIVLGIGIIIENICGIAKNIYMPEMIVYEYIKNIN